MVCLEKGMPERIPELGELHPIYLSDEVRSLFLCIVQDSQDQPFMGKEQAAEGIKRGMDNLVSFTNFFYCMDMQEIGFQHCQDKAQAVGRIGDQHFGKKGMGMSAGDTLYPWDTQNYRHWPVIL